jgi:wyosine [tRNA(Phe)-imidazoG37] synthetase (radical SAM superfamily)
MTVSLQRGLIYGPVGSRRLGRSLGINVLPGGAKICNFNCPYCQYGWTRAATPHRDSADWPAPGAIAEALEEALASGVQADRLTLAGNGEPTLHPRFEEIVARLRRVRARFAPHARLVVLSNSSTLGRPDIVRALRRLDERYMKLDAGGDEMLRRINGITLSVGQIVDGLRSLESPIVLQAMFARDRGRIDNTSAGAVTQWLGAVRAVAPLRVDVYTVDRPPAYTKLERVPRRILQEIADRVIQCGIDAAVYP